MRPVCISTCGLLIPECLFSAYRVDKATSSSAACLLAFGVYFRAVVAISLNHQFLSQGSFALGCSVRQPRPQIMLPLEQCWNTNGTCHWSSSRSTGVTSVGLTSRLLCDARSTEALATSRVCLGIIHQSSLRRPWLRRSLLSHGFW